MDSPTNISASLKSAHAWPAPPDVPQAPVPTRSRNPIFFGPLGLRAVWSLLIYLGILGCIYGGLHLAQKKMKEMQKAAVAAQSSAAKTSVPKAAPKAPDEEKPQPIADILLGESFLFGFFFLLSWLMAFIERRNVLVFGLGGIHFARRFCTGAIWGLFSLSVLVMFLRADHLLVFDAQLDHGAGIFGWGILLLVAFFIVGLFEEYMFRGYIQYTLTRTFLWLGNLISPKHSRAIAFWIASILTSAIFFKAHTDNAGETRLGLFMVFLAGLVFVIALWRTGSLWWAIGFHTTWDWAQSFLYGVPDSGGLIQGRLFATHATGNPMLSGGTVGPEGSVFVIPILLLVIVVLFFTKPSPQPLLEPKGEVSTLPPESPALIA